MAITALHLAIGDDNCTFPDDWPIGHKEVVRLLLEAPGIDINAKNNNGDTALHIAVCGDYDYDYPYYNYRSDEPRATNEEIVRLLLGAPSIEINLKTKNGDTALDLATKNSYIEVVKLLDQRKNISKM